MKSLLFTAFIGVIITFNGFSQAVPATEENIPYLVTFGNKGDKSWGDDDFSQTFFFVIPKTHKDPVYIRVYDPGVGGTIDEKKGEWNTKTKFSVYGGKGCVTEKDARASNPIGNYKSGNLLATKTFGDGYDQKWYTFGPFNPTSGELTSKYGGYVFKVIAEGISGDDGNLYKYFLSTSKTSNVEIEGGNAFTFEYTFRMHDDPKEVSHVYPYIDSEVISVKQGNFDWDNDGEMKIITNTRFAIHLDKSGDGNWKNSEHEIKESEKESSFDVQFHKHKGKPAKNNNVSFYITNQYNETLPFYTIPIGGVPKPPTSIKLTPNK
ncbi:hypothetical protein K6119_15565 [Paracrocinitomix mangrovi]|uniref:hypothetical protein n=1 Tax=Paracrocinitomix mangrovi TaxID=2862509 RepID=UPI001C8F01F8|nr:hypothetical protein [Paracrocinitomix mangrovi]UKN01147.1 hypothetical protein K6119_15565 [Paracrocinitomix mangrovi]